MSVSHDRDQRISRRLKHLYATVPGSSDELVAKGLAERGIKVSSQYIQQLRTGARVNPTINVVWGIAEVFGVPASYLIADDEEIKRINDQLALLVVLKKAGVTALALRAAALDDESRGWLQEQVDRELRRSGTPAEDQT